MQQASVWRNAAVWVAALGYFVDIYDLLLFSIVRVPSLTDLGVANSFESGLLIINVQMLGLMLGGILWGVLGDRLGRTRVLFLSILIYSLGNVANGLVQNELQYAIVRFLAGIGLAGELGAGITLVSELLPAAKRGIGTSMVAGIGLLGAVAAFFVAQAVEWRTAYFIGGGMGLSLLILRLRVLDSGLFHQTASRSDVERGNFLQLFRTRERSLRYLRCILVGLPTWFVIGILVSFSKEFATHLGITGEVDPGRGILYAYAAISLGDILIGFLSQALKSRKKALYVFYAITAHGMLRFFTASSVDQLYVACGIMGFGTGFWALFVTVGAESFGTNLRATAATTIPNMVRGSLNAISALFLWLTAQAGYLEGGMLTAVLVFAMTLWAAAGLTETFGRDLDFVEKD
jgi:MFS transporter, putative metabolite:H+ symporter